MVESWFRYLKKRTNILLMDWLKIINIDLISLILSFLGGSTMFLKTDNLLDIIDYEHRYKMVKNQMFTTLNFWSFTPHQIDDINRTISRQAFRSTFQQVNSIKDYWTYRFRKDHPYASHSPLPELDIYFITDTLSIPICNLLRGQHRKNKTYREHYHLTN